MATILLEALRKRTRQLADIQDDASFITEEELDGYINRGLWTLDDILHRTWEDYSCVEATYTVSGGLLNLELDFFKLVSVDVKDSSGRWVEMTPFTHADRNTYRNSTARRAEDNRYRLMNNTLVFLPGLPSSSLVIVNYYPQRELFTATDECVYPNGWEQLGVLHAAIQILTKEERDLGALTTLYAAEVARVEASAPMRDRTPPMLINVDENRDPHYFRR